MTLNTTPQATPNTAVALEFARAMAAGDVGRAHGLLSSGLQAALPPGQLSADYEAMISYGEGAPAVIEVVGTMDAWPDKESADQQWVYVSIANDTYLEAVTVVVTREASRLAIRSVEWGRP